MEAHVTPLKSERFSWLAWLPWALALAGLIYLAGLTVWLGIKGLAFPYQLDYGEGVLLHFVKEWSRGRPIYLPAQYYPRITSNYAPLDIVLALALTPLLGITYTVGRLWTLLAVAILAALILAWVRGDGRRWLPAVAATLLFVGSPYIYHWAPLFRVDLVGLALSLGGLFAVHLAAPRSTDRPAVKKTLLWLAVFLFIAALYTKQSFIFAPAAGFLYLFFFVDRRQALKLASSMIVLGGGLFLLINALTSGGFWYGLVASNVNPFLWPEFWEQQSDFFGTFAVTGLLAAWYVVDKFVMDRSMSFRDKVRPLDLYLPAALSSLFLAGKAGAWENYFFEALAILVLCGGLGLARLGRYGRWSYQFVAPLLLLVQVGLMWHTPQVADRYLTLTRQSNEGMAPILAGTPDPIISEDMGLLVTNDKVLDYYSFQNSQLARVGRWDQSWELGKLRDRNLSLVVLERGTRLDVDHYQRFTREFLSQLDLNYRHDATVGKYDVYKPDPLHHELRAEFGADLALVGWSLDAPAEVRPGKTINVTVVWQAQQPMATDYTAFAHLVDGDGQGWAGDDHQPYNGLYPTSAWGPGEMVRDTFTLTVPTGAPPGLYDIHVGWYDSITGERLPSDGESTFRVAVLPVDGAVTAAETLRPLGAQFGEVIFLQGYRLDVDPQLVRVTLRWLTEDHLDTDYTVFVHLADAENGEQMLAQSDAPPLAGRWPTSLWLPGTAVDDLHAIPLPLDLPPGGYELLVGLYDPTTGERLALADGRDALPLAKINLP
jgi:hypothetical protein